jgi:hypothetical protein
VADVVLILVAVSVGVFVFWPRSISPGPTEKNFSIVRIGMTFANVEAILGTYEIRDPVGRTSMAGIDNAHEGDYRFGEYYWVTFDRDGRVVSKSKYFPDREYRRTPW